MAINQPDSGQKDYDPGQKCQKEHLCIYLRSQKAPEMTRWSPRPNHPRKRGVGTATFSL